MEEKDVAFKASILFLKKIKEKKEVLQKTENRGSMIVIMMNKFANG